jgi:hypothetical protein
VPRRNDNGAQQRISCLDEYGCVRFASQQALCEQQVDEGIVRVQARLLSEHRDGLLHLSGLLQSKAQAGNRRGLLRFQLSDAFKVGLRLVERTELRVNDAAYRVEACRTGYVVQANLNHLTTQLERIMFEAQRSQRNIELLVTGVEDGRSA